MTIQKASELAHSFVGDIWAKTIKNDIITAGKTGDFSQATARTAFGLLLRESNYAPDIISLLDAAKGEALGMLLATAPTLIDTLLERASKNPMRTDMGGFDPKLSAKDEMLAMAHYMDFLSSTKGQVGFGGLEDIVVSGLLTGEKDSGKPAKDRQELRQILPVLAIQGKLVDFITSAVDKMGEKDLRTALDAAKKEFGAKGGQQR
jgi:hypothetical protein